MEKGTFKLVTDVRCICLKIQNDVEKSVQDKTIMELALCAKEMPNEFLRTMQPMLLAALFQYIKNMNSAKEENQIQAFNVLRIVCSKSKLPEESNNIFFNFLLYLLNTLYDPKDQIAVKRRSEEYKLSAIKCVIKLMESVPWENIPSIYTKQNVPKFCSLLHLCTYLIKNEQLVALRVSSIECIMATARILNDDDFADVEYQQLISETFLYLVPGIAETLIKACIDDSKCNHVIIVTALKAWTRLIVIVFRSYSDASEDAINVLQEFSRNLDEERVPTNKNRLKSKEDIEEYLNNIKRTPAWYRGHDVKLKICVQLLMPLTVHAQLKVRKEMFILCNLVTQHCYRTLPETVSAAIEVLITLSQDDDDGIAKSSTNVLLQLSQHLEDDGITTKIICDHLEHNFYNRITQLPRVFNELDVRKQITALNLITGYIQLFGQHRLKQVLFTYTNMHRLLISILHIAKLEKSNASVLEVYAGQDFRELPALNSPWKVFQFDDKTVQAKLEVLCQLLAKSEVSQIIQDLLLDMFVDDLESRKEATLVLNEMLSVPLEEDNLDRAKQVIGLYLEEEYWNIPTDANNDNQTKLADAHNNIIQICLQVEGIGKIALSIGNKFEAFLLKVLYPILERAGSSHPLLHSAGLAAAANIATACGFKTVSELVISNSDYFSYSISRKLKHSEYNHSVLKVLSVVMQHSDLTILPSVSHIIKDLLLESFDKHHHKNILGHLNVFKVYLKCVHKWFFITVPEQPLKTKIDKEKEIEDFRISNMETSNNDFSDEAVMGKTAEQMWEEDMAKSKEEVMEEPTIEEYKKPDPPMHIALTVQILRHSLNFLPSKDASCKILVVEILNVGVEILHDWEDELLPIVHLIWSPLVHRFKEYDAPLIVNLSFKLLTTLAKLSKCFIRSRTVKEVLPSLAEGIRRQSKQSYLKDKGSAYRYTQGYKMQLVVLPQLFRLLYDLDAAENGYEIINAAMSLYLSNKQPKILQQAAIDFYKKVIDYNAALGKRLITHIESNCKSSEYANGLASIHAHVEESKTC